MSSLNDVKVEYVVETYNILFFQDSNVSVYIKVFQVFLPLIKTYDVDYGSEDLLKVVGSHNWFICRIQSALYDDLVKVGEHFVFLKDHTACP